MYWFTAARYLCQNRKYLLREARKTQQHPAKEMLTEAKGDRKPPGVYY